MSQPKNPPPPKDNIRRGDYTPDLAGTTTFVGLRLLDPLLQYQLLLPSGWGATLLSSTGLSLAPIDGPVVALGLPLSRLLLLAFSVGSTAKQVFWLTCLCRETFPAPLAVMVSAYNTLVNSLNSLLLIAAATSTASVGPVVRIPGTPYALGTPVVVGTVLYVVGMFLETVSEVQRKRFKDRPEAKGRIITTGLWRLARHINYGGYALWRAGYFVAAGGWIPGLLLAAQPVVTFLMGSMPAMDVYMERKYGGQWVTYRRDVPWKLLPWVY